MMEQIIGTLLTSLDRSSRGLFGSSLSGVLQVICAMTSSQCCRLIPVCAFRLSGCGGIWAVQYLKDCLDNDAVEEANDTLRVLIDTAR